MGRKITILEDEEVLGKVYTKKLSTAGYEVKWLTTVEETEASFAVFAPDVVLLDHGIRYHEKAGVDLIPIVRERFPEAKIIMLSNYSHGELQQKALSAGANLYLIKINTTPSQLIQQIEKLFD